ncbi:MAG: PQQ-binding-like beta-propeller repeat protein [Rhodothermales bacterium]
MRRAVPLITIGLICLAAAGCAGDAPEDVDRTEGWAEGWTDRLNNTVDWGIYRGDKTGIQYSELSQITTRNVHLLEPAWEYRHGDPNGPSMYSNAIVVDGRMYFTTPKVNAVALDAETGEELWVFAHADYDDDDRDFRGRNRGVTYWEDADGSGGRIFNFVKDRVYAIDAASGEPITSFGEGGFIDLRQNLPVPPEEAYIEVTTPGIVYRDVLIVGSRVPEGNETTPGDVRAYDARTGAFRWIFHTIPLEGEFGYDTWEWEEGITYGGANPWGGFTLDEERGWVFFATGSAAGDFIYGGTRKGMNLFSSTVLALDATTGERMWHYQTIHHDIFDYDNPPAPVLATITSGGEERDVAVQGTKMGFTFVLDRDTGEPIFPVEELPVPPSDVPGEEAWPTQPFPLKPPPLVRQSMHEADITNITPEAHAAVLEEFKKYRTGPLFTPASVQGTITLPGHQGGAEWGGAAFDPATNVMYVNVNEAPTINRLEPLRDETAAESAAHTPASRGRRIYNANCTACHGMNRSGNPPLYPPLSNLGMDASEMRDVIRQGRGVMPSFPQFSGDELDDLVAYLSSPPDAEQAPSGASPEEATGDGSATPHSTAQSTSQPTPQFTPQYANISPFFTDPDGYPAIAPPWGTLNAVDLDRGEILWKVPLGEYPELVERGIRNTGAKNFGGPVLTAGDVIFIAGTPDEKIRAFDKRSGDVLWEYKLPAGGYATPSVYEIDGTQYVAITAGGGGKPGTPYADAVIAFALPDSLR